MKLNFKKTAILLLSFVLVFAISACQPQEETKTEENQSSQNSETTNATEKAETTESEKSSETTEATEKTTEVAEIVIKNATIYTENPEQAKAEALAIKDGKIVFVGSNADAEQFVGEATEVKDLTGKTVIPSLMDSHTHPGMVGASAGNAALTKYQLPRTSKEDMYEYLKKIAKENPDAPFLMVGQWSNKLYGVEGSDRKYIDRIESISMIFSLKQLYFCWIVVDIAIG